ncbi:MAG: GGDEF domain-containing protein [Butyrivibrio sp.]|nr:GGDEF domain-containing protein [Butyrivibrio sp.]
MKNYAKMQAAILGILAIVIMASSILFLGSAKLNTPPKKDIVQLDSGWTISHEKKTYTVDSLQDANLGMVNNKEIVILESTLPNSEIYPASIQFRSILATVDVYVDNDLIYTYGHLIADDKKMVPKMQNFISLPTGYSGKKLKIVMVSCEDEAFSGFSDIYFGTFSDISTYLLQKNRLSLIIGAFLCIFGFILLILAPILTFSDFHDYSIIFSALTSLSMGIYILCYNDIFWFFTDHASIANFLEYFSLFSIPAVNAGFVMSSKQTKHLLLCKIFLIVDVGFMIVTSAFHVLNIIHICRFILCLHILAIVEGLSIIGSIVITIISRAKSRKEFDTRIYSTDLLIVGFILLLGCSMIDIIKFNVLKYLKMGEVNATISFMTIGSFFFMLCLLINYFYHCIEYINESTVQSQLEGLAYTDSLTRLSNRAKCELSLANTKGRYTIISIDLDYLKYTNDNYGHSAGDTLLSGFATMLKSSFIDASLVGRMGGDEFIVVLPYIDASRRDTDLAILSELMNYRNGKNSTIHYSASWGYAESLDPSLNNPSAQLVYLLADKRMYSMKKKHHNESLGRLYSDLMKSQVSKEVSPSNA